MVMEMQGPSLADVQKNFNGRGLSLKSVLIIADQVLIRLKDIHQCGLLHCHLKPDNLTTGATPNRASRIQIRDFRFAKVYKDCLTGELLDP